MLPDPTGVSDYGPGVIASGVEIVGNFVACVPVLGGVTTYALDKVFQFTNIFFVSCMFMVLMFFFCWKNKTKPFVNYVDQTAQPNLEYVHSFCHAPEQPASTDSAKYQLFLYVL